MKICAATGNAGKLRELRRILEAQGHEVVSQKELGITLEPEETGTTFAANALIKAETICKASGMATIADDSGLCVDALEGAPGVYSARYCGHHGDDEANNDKLLENMKDVPAGKRGAKFVSAVCFILPDGKHLTCMGEKNRQAPQHRGPQLRPADPGRKRRHQPPRQRAGKTRRRITEVFSKMSWTAGSFLGETSRCPMKTYAYTHTKEKQLC